MIKVPSHHLFFFFYTVESTYVKDVIATLLKLENKLVLTQRLSKKLILMLLLVTGNNRTTDIATLTPIHSSFFTGH